MTIKVLSTTNMPKKYAVLGGKESQAEPEFDDPNVGMLDGIVDIERLVKSQVNILKNTPILNREQSPAANAGILTASEEVLKDIPENISEEDLDEGDSQTHNEDVEEDMSISKSSSVENIDETLGLTNVKEDYHSNKSYDLRSQNIINMKKRSSTKNKVQSSKKKKTKQPKKENKKDQDDDDDTSEYDSSNKRETTGGQGSRNNDDGYEDEREDEVEQHEEGDEGDDSDPGTDNVSIKLDMIINIVQSVLTNQNKIMSSLNALKGSVALLGERLTEVEKREPTKIENIQSSSHTYKSTAITTQRPPKDIKVSRGNIASTKQIVIEKPPKTLFSGCMTIKKRNQGAISAAREVNYSDIKKGTQKGDLEKEEQSSDDSSSEASVVNIPLSHVSRMKSTKGKEKTSSVLCKATSADKQVQKVFFDSSLSTLASKQGLDWLLDEPKSEWEWVRGRSIEHLPPLSNQENTTKVQLINALKTVLVGEKGKMGSRISNFISTGPSKEKLSILVQIFNSVYREFHSDDADNMETE